MKRVVQIHDAAIDEYMSTLMLTTMDSVQLDGIVVVNADCIYGPAMTAAWRIQQYIEQSDIPLTLSGARGINPFPWAYRGDCIKQASVDSLFRMGDGPFPPYPDGDEWLLQYLEQVHEAGDTVTLLVLCPMTPIEELLKRLQHDCPHLLDVIDGLLWMGGAIHVKGNLDPATFSEGNDFAEWNVFWDPPAAEWVLKNATFPITMFPLDVTNDAAITTEFMNSLADQAAAHDGSSPNYSQLAHESYAIVSAESFYDMWDVVATVYLTRPELFTAPTPMTLRVEEYGPKQGGIFYPADDGRRAVDVILEFADQAGFYDYVLQQFATGASGNET